MDVIQSLSNPRVKLWSSLQERKHRERERLFVAEGIHLVKEAILSGADIAALVYSDERGMPEELQPLASSVREQYAVTEAILAKCTNTISPQAVFAVVRRANTTPADILASHRSLVLIADGVQDPGNLGTMIRSADAVGASAVLLGKGTVDLYNAKTIRSTMGSLFHLPIAECDLAEVLPQARERSVQVAAARLEEARSCYQADFTKDTWLVLGNEGQGVSDTTLQHADLYVTIPMAGHAESLNVAMASTVLLFEAMRQRSL